MKYVSSFVFWLPILLLFIAAVFLNWFLSPFISAGDFSLIISDPNNLSYLPYAWSNSGLGSNGTYLLFSYPIQLILILLIKLLEISPAIALKIVYFFPFILFSAISMFILSKRIIFKTYALISAAIFLFNTYILMVVAGGQMGVALGYSITPLVIYSFLNILDNRERIKNFILFSLMFSIQITFDLRIAYITLFGIFIHWFLEQIKNKDVLVSLKSFIFSFFLPGVLSFFLHFFWILPLLVSHQNPITQLGAAYSTTGAVEYFSFAKFENSVSLLHPNWPENIFGKIGFMPPEFLLLPVLAFSSLFFVSRVKDIRLKTYVLFFALLGLIGAFLAKGANEPFGILYLWMFDHIPGFIMFRDPTKWYTLIAISYSILIPFTIYKIYDFIKLKTENLKLKAGKQIPNLFIVLVLGYMLFLIRPAITGQLTGTFKPASVPGDYVKLESFLVSQDSFSRTLWVPTNQRFGFYSSVHPAVPAGDFFNIYDNTKLVQKIASSESLLQNSSIRYVVVPYDSQGEIFLSDRKYDSTLYLKTINDVAKISYLKRIMDFGKIAVFEVPNVKGHFYIETQNLKPKTEKVEYHYISPVEYKIELQNAKKGELLVFSENFDKNWAAIAASSKLKVQSTEYGGRFNSFVLPKNGTYSLDVYYSLQKYVEIGEIISIATLFLVLGYLVLMSRKSIKI